MKFYIKDNIRTITKTRNEKLSTEMLHLINPRIN